MGLIYDIRPTKVFIEELEDTVRYIQYNLQNEIAQLEANETNEN